LYGDAIGIVAVEVDPDGFVTADGEGLADDGVGIGCADRDEMDDGGCVLFPSVR